MDDNKTEHQPFYNPELWNWHDIYYQNMSYSRVVTRSQTAFNRIVLNDEEFDLFGDSERHQPPNLPHLMFTMKDGMYGAIPRTIITRSTSRLLGTSPILSKTIEAYKTFYPMIHAGELTHGHDDLGHKVQPEYKVFPHVKIEQDERMEEDQDQQPPRELESHAQRFVSTPPEVLRESLASMKFCYDDERLVPKSAIASTSSTAPVSDPSKSAYLPKSLKSHHEPETVQESERALPESFQTHRESVEMETETDSASSSESSITEHQVGVGGVKKKFRKRAKGPNDPVRFLHDLLDSMSDRPTDDHMYEEKKDDDNQEN